MSENELARLHAEIEGRVQGVGFRYFVEENALSLGLKGWVRNRWTGTVEVTAEGERARLHNFLGALQRGTRASYVANVKVNWGTATGEFDGFQIRQTA